MDSIPRNTTSAASRSRCSRKCALRSTIDTLHPNLAYTFTISAAMYPPPTITRSLGNSVNSSASSAVQTNSWTCSKPGRFDTFEPVAIIAFRNDTRRVQCSCETRIRSEASKKAVPLTTSTLYFLQRFAIPFSSLEIESFFHAAIFFKSNETDPTLIPMALGFLHSQYWFAALIRALDGIQPV